MVYFIFETDMYMTYMCHTYVEVTKKSWTDSHTLAKQINKASRLFVVFVFYRKKKKKLETGAFLFPVAE